MDSQGDQNSLSGTHEDSLKRGFRRERDQPSYEEGATGKRGNVESPKEKPNGDSKKRKREQEER